MDSKRFLVLTVMAAAGARAQGSDVIGIYALIDKVVLEPASGPVYRAQVWGAFSLAGKPGTGDSYDAPVRGFLYYEVQPGQEMATGNEWADLQSVAGKGEVVGFASRYEEKGTIHTDCLAPAKPDPYPINIGVMKARSPDLPAVQALLSLPVPVSPEDCASVMDPGQVTLVVRNASVPLKYDAYVFELRDRHGAVETSPPVPAGEASTSWTPGTAIAAGESYVWTVLRTDGVTPGPAVGASFSLPFLRGDPNGDGVVDLSDAVAILTYLFQAGRAPRPPEAADVDGNGSTDVTDAVYLLTYLYVGGKAPPAPFPARGLLP